MPQSMKPVRDKVPNASSDTSFREIVEAFRQMGTVHLAGNPVGREHCLNAVAPPGAAGTDYCKHLTIAQANYVCRVYFSLDDRNQQEFVVVLLDGAQPSIKDLRNGLGAIIGSPNFPALRGAAPSPKIARRLPNRPSSPRILEMLASLVFLGRKAGQIMGDDDLLPKASELEWVDRGCHCAVVAQLAARPDASLNVFMQAIILEQGRALLEVPEAQEEHPAEPPRPPEWQARSAVPTQGKGERDAGVGSPLTPSAMEESLEQIMDGNGSEHGCILAHLKERWRSAVRRPERHLSRTAERQTDGGASHFSQARCLFEDKLKDESEPCPLKDDATSLRKAGKDWSGLAEKGRSEAAGIGKAAVEKVLAGSDKLSSDTAESFADMFRPALEHTARLVGTELRGKCDERLRIGAMTEYVTRNMEMRSGLGGELTPEEKELAIDKPKELPDIVKKKCNEFHKAEWFELECKKLFEDLPKVLAKEAESEALRDRIREATEKERTRFQNIKKIGFDHANMAQEASKQITFACEANALLQRISGHDIARVKAEMTRLGGVLGRLHEMAHALQKHEETLRQKKLDETREAQRFEEKVFEAAHKTKARLGRCEEEQRAAEKLCEELPKVHSLLCREGKALVSYAAELKTSIGADAAQYYVQACNFNKVEKKFTENKAKELECKMRRLEEKVGAAEADYDPDLGGSAEEELKNRREKLKKVREDHTKRIQKIDQLDQDSEGIEHAYAGVASFFGGKEEVGRFLPLQGTENDPELGAMTLLGVRTVPEWFRESNKSGLRSTVRLDDPGFMRKFTELWANRGRNVQEQAGQRCNVGFARMLCGGPRRSSRVVPEPTPRSPASPPPPSRCLLPSRSPPCELRQW